MTPDTANSIRPGTQFEIDELHFVTQRGREAAIQLRMIRERIDKLLSTQTESERGRS